jgi:hypothetical protein
MAYLRKPMVDLLTSVLNSLCTYYSPSFSQPNMVAVDSNASVVPLPHHSLPWYRKRCCEIHQSPSPNLYEDASYLALSHIAGYHQALWNLYSSQPWLEFSRRANYGIALAGGMLSALQSGKSSGCCRPARDWREKIVAHEDPRD